MGVPIILFLILKNFQFAKNKFEKKENQNSFDIGGAKSNFCVYYCDYDTFFGGLSDYGYCMTLAVSIWHWHNFFLT